MYLQNASTVKELHHLLESEEYDFHYNLWVTEQVHKVCLEERDAICTHMVNHFSIYHDKGELDQILCRLSETLGVLDLIRSEPNMRCLLVLSEKAPLSANVIFDMFVPVYFPQGSNRRKQEEFLVMKSFHFLQCIEGQYLHYFTIYCKFN